MNGIAPQEWKPAGGGFLGIGNAIVALRIKLAFPVEVFARANCSMRVEDHRRARSRFCSSVAADSSPSREPTRAPRALKNSVVG